MNFIKHTKNKVQAKFALADENIRNNIILADDVQLSLDTAKTGKNLNVCVFGGSGAGKTRNYVLPNILQANTSFVITDHGGYLLNKTRKFLEEQGYVIKVLNLSDTEHSNHYNPFAYLHNEEDIINLAKVITKCEGYKDGDPFLVKCEKLLYTALIALIYCEFPDEEKHFGTLLRLINQMCETKEDDETFKNSVDIAFEKLETEKGENHFAVNCYKKFKLIPEKTAKSILASCAVKLAMFGIEKIEKMTTYDDMELDLIGDRKTAVFILLPMYSLFPTSNYSFNFLISLLITQIFNTLYSRANSLANHKLPVHVRFMLDEFSSCGYIPDFEKYIAVCGSRNISFNIILQCVEQLQTLYKYWDIILGNCDSRLYLGYLNVRTLNHISETVDIQMTSDELFRYNMNKSSECILSIRGLPAFCGEKFDVEKHINYGRIEK